MNNILNKKVNSLKRATKRKFKMTNLTLQTVDVLSTMFSGFSAVLTQPFSFGNVSKLGTL